ncbi:fibulin-1-like [Physeter macrocephalus]|uniref:Fibulin-1-like n=1 Tax=Physeter macrocephalus TaxID=9755 RepID=A0A9W2WJE4_PHYMC|nr:fibulin-1-like [Physeter catodon]
MLAGVQTLTSGVVSETAQEPCVAPTTGWARSQEPGRHSGGTVCLGGAAGGPAQRAPASPPPCSVVSPLAEWALTLFFLSVHFSCSRCERLPCHENQECPKLPLRITYYHLSFPTNIQVPAVVFRMGPSSAVPGDSMKLAITGGNEEGFFTTQKVSHHSGVVALAKPVPEPRDLLLTIRMDLSRHGTVSSFVAKLYIFVSAEL